MAPGGARIVSIALQAAGGVAGAASASARPGSRRATEVTTAVRTSVPVTDAPTQVATCGRSRTRTGAATASQRGSLAQSGCVAESSLLPAIRPAATYATTSTRVVPTDMVYPPSRNYG